MHRKAETLLCSPAVPPRWHRNVTADPRCFGRPVCGYRRMSAGLHCTSPQRCPVHCAVGTAAQCNQAVKNTAGYHRPLTSTMSRGHITSCITSCLETDEARPPGLEKSIRMRNPQIPRADFTCFPIPI